MRRELVLASALVLALGVPLVGCSGTTGADGAETDGPAASQSSDFDATEAYWGQWRGSVATTETTMYGNEGGTESMLDVNLEQDGTCTVEPLEDHADLLTDEGTWEGTESEVTLHLSSGDITLTVVDNVTLEGSAADFDIADFDTIQFDFYG